MKIYKMLKSFSHAISGVFILLKVENNAKFHMLILIFAVILGYLLNINTTEWCFVLLCTGSVFAAEAFNTSIEKLCDVITLETKNEIKIIKDIAAAGVLFSALASLFIGLCIFLPKIIAKL